MKQSTLNFTAAKRTVSNINASKRKVSSSVSLVPEKLKVAKSSKRLPSKKRDVSDEESDYDDKESSEEGIVQTATVEEKQKKGDLADPQDSGTRDPQQTRSEKKLEPSTTTKKWSSKVQDLETRRSLPFKESNVKPEVLQDKVNANDIIDQLPELDPSSKKWNKQYASARAKQGGLSASLCALLPVRS